MELTVPRTHFKIGDKLRLTVEVWARNTSGGTGGQVGIGHDPKNRQGTRMGADQVTKLDFLVPIVVQT